MSFYAFIFLLMMTDIILCFRVPCQKSFWRPPLFIRSFNNDVVTDQSFILISHVLNLNNSNQEFSLKELTSRLEEKQTSPLISTINSFTDSPTDDSLRFSLSLVCDEVFSFIPHWKRLDISVIYISQNLTKTNLLFDVNESTEIWYIIRGEGFLLSSSGSSMKTEAVAGSLVYIPFGFKFELQHLSDTFLSFRLRIKDRLGYRQLLSSYAEYATSGFISSDDQMQYDFQSPPGLISESDRAYIRRQLKSQLVVPLMDTVSRDLWLGSALGAAAVPVTSMAEKQLAGDCAFNSAAEVLDAVVTKGTHCLRRAANCEMIYTGRSDGRGMRILFVNGEAFTIVPKHDIVPTLTDNRLLTPELLRPYLNASRSTTLSWRLVLTIIQRGYLLPVPLCT